MLILIRFKPRFLERKVQGVFSILYIEGHDSSAEWLKSTFATLFKFQNKSACFTQLPHIGNSLNVVSSLFLVLKSGLLSLNGHLVVSERPT